MSWKKHNVYWPSRPFSPSEAKSHWETGHARVVRRRIARVAVTPEEIGLCGCWQVIAVRRERIELGRKAGSPSDETWCYATSLAYEQMSDEEMDKITNYQGNKSMVSNYTTDLDPKLFMANRM